jgi:hypothetical protein
MRLWNISAVLAFAAIMLISCAPGEHSGEQQVSATSAAKAVQRQPSTASTQPTITTPSVSAGFKPYPPLWEAANSQGAMWTGYAFQVVGGEAANLLDGAQDIGQFCPRYYQMNTQQKINFWVYLMSAVAKYESDFKPTDRYIEPGMGTDPITHQRVVSEGLLQLSYQDERGRTFCKFDWDHDRGLPTKSPQKTILNPLTNLECGIDILAQQVREHHRISVNAGAYWSTLETGNRYGKIPQIRALTHKIPFC